MKKYLLFLAALITLCSCGTTRLVQKQVTQSAWITVSPGEVDGVTGDVMMALFFTTDKDVKIMVSVQSEDQLIVQPFEFARGTYTIDNTTKKGNGIILNLKTIQGKPLEMKGTYEKGDALVLISDDEVTRMFAKIKDVKFE